MDQATARARLERDTAWESDPALDSAAVDDLVDIAKRRDANGVAPDEDGWVPTWDLNAAAAVGWRWKAAAAAGRADVSSPGGQSISRSAVYDHCMSQAAHFDGYGIGVLPIATTEAAYRSQLHTAETVIGNL